MLVLSRHKGQSIYIGGRLIRVQVVEVRPNGVVCLGIDAPPEIAVHRGEVQERVEQERRQP